MTMLTVKTDSAQTYLYCRELQRKTNTCFFEMKNLGENLICSDAVGDGSWKSSTVLFLNYI